MKEKEIFNQPAFRTILEKKNETKAKQNVTKCARGVAL